MSETGMGSHFNSDSVPNSIVRKANPDSLASPKDLTADQFEGLLRKLDTDRNQAGEKYEDIRWKLVRFFQWNDCLAAEELVDETLNRVAKKLAAGEQEIPDVAAYAWGIAKRIKQEALRRDLKTIHIDNLPAIESLGSTGVSTEAANDRAQNQTRLKFLRICIRRLSAFDRRLLLAYHAPKGRKSEGRKQLAHEAGITALALRVRINRLRFRVEDCIKKRLASRTD